MMIPPYYHIAIVARNREETIEHYESARHELCGAGRYRTAC
jgi:hypothetical protein